MATLYDLFKVSLDPIFFLIILIAVGFIISFVKGKEKSVRYYLLAAFTILYLASIFPISNMLSYVLEKEYLSEQNNSIDSLDIVVVLGGGTFDNEYLKETKPTSRTSSRLLYAVQMFRKSGATFLICSGKGLTRLSEAEVMAISAERLGVPKDKIKIDPLSKNTWEHAKNLDKMFKDKNIRIGLVTSAYHMKRSTREFRKYFHNVTSLPTDFLYVSSQLSFVSFMPRSGNLAGFSNAAHELLGIVWYRLKADRGAL